MSASADMITDLRRKIVEPAQSPYSDALLTRLIEARPMPDVNGQDPFNSITVTLNVPTYDDNTSWLPTYDLNAVAGEIWAEKANLLYQNHDFSADGGNYARSQAYEHAMKQSRYYLARRAMTTVTLQLPIDVSELDDDE